jgi:hypothetical protein
MLPLQTTLTQAFHSRFTLLRGVLHHRAPALCALVILATSALGFGTTLAAQSLPTGTPHSVTLKWTPPATVGGSGIVAGYNVYRSIAGVAFVKINTALVVPATFLDSGVSAGQSLAYCVTTVDSTAEESACSTAASATVPMNPNPSTGLTVTVQ